MVLLTKKGRQGSFPLPLLLLLSAGFSLQINVNVDDRPFEFGIPFQISPGLHVISLNISGSYPLKINAYSIRAFPENLEVVMEELLDIPLHEVVDLPILPSEHTFEFLLDVPEGLCGQYILDITLNYTEVRKNREKNYKAVVWVPCNSVNSFLIYLLLRMLPKFLFRGFLNYFGG